MKTVSVSTGDYVLIDPCYRWIGSAHPQNWLIGQVERGLESEPQRFLIRYLAPDSHGLSYRIHTPRSMRAVGSEAHVRHVYAGVLAHMQRFVKELTRIEKDESENEKKWQAYSKTKDKISDREHDVWERQRAAMKALHQPGLIQWSRNGRAIL